MSKLVRIGMILHTALTAAGHTEFHTVRAGYDLYMDDILVRFDRGLGGEQGCVSFRIPAYLFDSVEFDPVEYAQKKWPDWFVKKEPVSGEQLDLFNQE